MRGTRIAEVRTQWHFQGRAKAADSRETGKSQGGLPEVSGLTLKGSREEESQAQNPTSQDTAKNDTASSMFLHR